MAKLDEKQNVALKLIFTKFSRHLNATYNVSSRKFKSLGLISTQLDSPKVINYKFQNLITMLGIQANFELSWLKVKEMILALLDESDLILPDDVVEAIVDKVWLTRWQKCIQVNTVCFMIKPNFHLAYTDI